MGRFQREIILRAACLMGFCFLNGCESAGREEPLNSGISFKIYEGYGYQDSIKEPEIYIRMETREPYNYAGVIELDQRVRGDEIVFNIGCVSLGCYPVVEPATWLGQVDIPDGSYDLHFSYRNFEDEYKLIVTDSSIELTPETSLFTDAAFTTYWRYPKNSFACYAFTSEDVNESTSILFEGFIDTLLSQLELEDMGFPTYPGDAEACYPRTGWSEYHGYIRARYFKYESESDFEKAGDILEAYVQGVIPDSSSLRITLKNWKNKRYVF